MWRPEGRRYRSPSARDTGFQGSKVLRFQGSRYTTFVPVFLVPANERQPPMRDVALRALDTARLRGASYADVRIVQFQSQSVAARNENIEGLVVEESLG